MIKPKHSFHLQSRCALVVATPKCAIEFANPDACRWMADFFTSSRGPNTLPSEVCHWLSSDGGRNALLARKGDGRLLVRRYLPHPRDAIALLFELVDREAVKRSTRIHRPLTRREMEVLGWVAAGKTNWVIAQILDLSPATVGKHLERIFAKLGVETRTEASHYYLSLHAKIA